MECGCQFLILTVLLDIRWIIYTDNWRLYMIGVNNLYMTDMDNR